MNQLIKYVEAVCNPQSEQGFPSFKTGDTVNVHVKIQEGNRIRIQQFQGIVIQRKNSNTAGETFTVRKVTKEIGVERIFPLNSPDINKLEVKRRGKVRRARIYYLRGKRGKAARIKELR